MSGDVRRVEFSIPRPLPLVSVIIPTKDKLPLLRKCVDGLLHDTGYANLEIIIMDNASSEDETLEYFEAIGGHECVRIIPWTRKFDFSALNNAGALESRGEVLAFINNDIEVVEPGWLEALVRDAMRPDVGAVGPLLLYPSGAIQHGGIILGVGGVAALRHRGRDPRAELACDKIALATRNLSAVTAACLVLRRAVFEEVGGFEEKNLEVAFNDVDLCLRIREHGYRILWTPHVVLRHHESQSLKQHDRPERAQEFQQEIEFMRSRWLSLLQDDPFYNPNLSLELDRDFTLAFPPRRRQTPNRGAVH